jgi:hypothetical protein
MTRSRFSPLPLAAGLAAAAGNGEFFENLVQFGNL